MLAPDRLKRDVFADIAVQHDLHPGPLEQFDPAHDHVFLELETGDAIGHQPTGAVVAVIDRHLNPGAAQHVGGGQTRRTSADDSHAFAALGRRHDLFDPAIVPRGVGDVFLDRADGHGAVARFLDHAIAFAQPVLRADAAADLGEGVGGLAQLVGFLEATHRRHPQPIGDVVVQRAMRLAVGHPALAAPRCLLCGFLLGVFRVDLVEIMATQIRCPLLGHVAVDIHESQHRLLGHFCRLRFLRSAF